MQIWDMPGTERYAELAGLTGCLKSADGLMLVCDITNRRSFDSLAFYRSNFLGLRKLPTGYDFPMVLCANKSDKDDDREVLGTETTDWMQDFVHSRPGYERRWLDALGLDIEKHDVPLGLGVFSTCVTVSSDDPQCGIPAALEHLCCDVILRWATRFQCS